MKATQTIFSNLSLILFLLFFTLIPNQVLAQNPVLTKVNGGTSWVKPNVSLKGSGATTVTGSYPNYTVSSTSGGSYSAGTGISITSGNRVNNTAPDKTVILRGAGSTTISGTYPDFTVNSTSGGITYSAGSDISIATSNVITNTAPDKKITIKGTGGTTVTENYPEFTISSSSGGGLTAGTGISISSKRINNNKPDKVVKITGTGGATIGGNYPNFTIGTSQTTSLGSRPANATVNFFTSSTTNSLTPSLSGEQVIFINTAHANCKINLPPANDNKYRIFTFIKATQQNSLVFDKNIITAPGSSKTTFSGNDVKLTIVSSGCDWYVMED